MLLQGLYGFVVGDINLPGSVLAKADGEEEGIWVGSVALHLVPASPVFWNGVLEYKWLI